MSTKVGMSLSWVLDDIPLSGEDLMWEHAMDISASIYTRMTELGMSQKELAKKMNMDQAQLSRIIRGDANLTIKTLARLESALDFDLGASFRYKPYSRAVPHTYTESCVYDNRFQKFIPFNINPSPLTKEGVAA